MAKKHEYVNSLKEINSESLEAKLTDECVRLKKLKFAHAVTPLENPMTIRAVRKDIARIKTEITKRQITA